MIFRKKAVPEAARQELPDLTFSVQSLREMWWNLFVELLYMSVDDPESLVKIGSAPARYIESARAVADAAISEYESRWGIPTREDREGA